MNHHLLALLIVLLLCRCALCADKPALPYFTIHVVDEDTGRGVPLVELKTTNDIRYVTDSNGIVAFYEPGLMNTDVFFHVQSHGYSYPRDNFGYAGLALKTAEGGSATVRIKRDNIAQRLYRVTGQGIYADSLLVGHPVPLEEPAVNGLVLGQDSVLSCVSRGKLLWIWGDTDRPAYPLGNFHVSGATSLLLGKGGLDPEAGVELTYFVRDDGFSKAMMPWKGPGPVWLSALVALEDGERGERLYARYSNVDNAMKAQEIGLAEFDDEEQIFKKIVQFDLGMPIQPNGHPFRVSEKNADYLYFSPLTRVRADVKSFKDPSAYEAYTCLKEGSRKDDPQIETAHDGTPVYGWRHNAPALFPQDEAKLIKEGKLKSGNALFNVRDVATGKPVLYHGASISWNEYRNRYVMIMQEAFGTSFLGETWYLEADRPEGPWVYARKIVTHENYSFYNPRHHPMFDKDGGRTIFFEATYTSGFTNNQYPTPRYDYNQIMYKLDLADPRLALPVAVYGDRSGDFPGLRLSDRPGPEVQQAAPIAFFAPDRPMEGTLPVYARGWALEAGKSGTPPSDRHARFHALPADMQDPPPTTTPLYEYTNETKRESVYSTDPAWSRAGFVRAEKPFCLVWRR